MRAIKSWGLALILVLAMAAWMSTGTLIRGGSGPHDGEVTVAEAVDGGDGSLSDAIDSTGIAREPHHKDGVESPALSIAERNVLLASEGEELRSVRTRRFVVEDMSLAVTLRGHTAVHALVDASVRTSDIVQVVHVQVGQSVDAGDLVCSLDPGTRSAAVDQARASLLQAEAALDQAESNYRTNQALLEKNLVSANSSEGVRSALSSAQANHEAAMVSLRNREVELENTEVRATVSGLVQRPVAKVGDLLNSGDSCARIVKLDPMIFVGSIPQARIALARIGLEADIETIDGNKAVGVVKYLAAIADTSTRTFEIEIEFPNPAGKILAGQTAQATVELGSIPAHLVPQSIMTLDPQGRFGVRAVNDGKVVFYPLEILRDTREGAWVRGLPMTVDVIVIGQDYVTAGQSVTASLEE